ncbi:hypothetical protein BKA80DRAFT_300896 [Phyllosticta citrichinensis]
MSIIRPTLAVAAAVVVAAMVSDRERFLRIGVGVGGARNARGSGSALTSNSERFLRIGVGVGGAQRARDSGSSASTSACFLRNGGGDDGARYACCLGVFGVDFVVK